MKNVLITRQPEQSIELINLLSKKGFSPYIIPMIETTPVNFELESNMYDYVIFTSPNGVKYFLGYIKKIVAKKYVAVGSKTAEILHSHGITDIEIDIPDIFSQEGLVDYFRKNIIDGKHILLPSPEKSSGKLQNFLKSGGAIIEKPVIYKTDKLKYEKGEVFEFLKDFDIDTIIFASPSAAEAFFNNVDKNQLSDQMFYISIGKTTHEFLHSCFGIKSYYPEEYTVNGMIDLLNNLRRI